MDDVKTKILLLDEDIIRPEFANILERIEDHTIRTIASILKNDNNYPSLGVGEYRLANIKWKKI